jgi:hypothetical protein
MGGFCTNCGAELRTDDRFCGKCGKAIGEAAAAPTPTPGESPARGRLAGILGSSVLLPLLGIGIFFATMHGCEKTEGKVAVSGNAHGNYTFTPTGCASMQPYGRMGANLHGDGHNDGAVYVTSDPSQGTRVELEVPGSCKNADGSDCIVFPVPRDHCETYDVHVEYQNITVNEVRLVKGHLALTCELSDGTSVRGQITFEGC